MSPKQQHDPAHKGRPYLEEADIGSGEKTPAERETDEMIREIPPLPPRHKADGNGERNGQRPASGRE